MESLSSDSFIQILEECSQRVIRDSLTQRIIRDSNRTFEICIGIVAEQSTVGLVLKVDLANRVDRAACTLALNLQFEVIGFLTVCNVNNDPIRSLQTGQRRCDVRANAIGAQIFN